MVAFRIYHFKLQRTCLALAQAISAKPWLKYHIACYAGNVTEYHLEKERYYSTIGEKIEIAIYSPNNSNGNKVMFMQQCIISSYGVLSIL
jgi:hypothetical protein